MDIFFPLVNSASEVSLSGVKILSKTDRTEANRFL